MVLRVSRTVLAVKKLGFLDEWMQSAYLLAVLDCLDGLIALDEQSAILQPFTDDGLPLQGGHLIKMLLVFRILDSIGAIALLYYRLKTPFCTFLDEVTQIDGAIYADFSTLLGGRGRLAWFLK